MEPENKKTIIKYSVLVGMFLAFVLMVFGLTFLVDYITKDNYKDALENFFSSNDTLPAEYKNIKIKFLGQIGDGLTSSYKNNLASISVEAFFVKHNSGTFFVFITPIFTNAGLANAVFISETVTSQIIYLGILENRDYKISNSEILHATKKLQSLFMEATK